MSKPKNADWKQLKNFPIGTKVLVSAVYKQHDDTDDASATCEALATGKIMTSVWRREWKAEPCAPFVAWVSGGRWQCDGTMTRQTTCDAAWDTVERGANKFRATRKIPALLVRKCQFGPEVAVPISSVEEIPFQLSAQSFVLAEPAPILASQRTPLDDAARAALRDKAKTKTRGPGGKFTSPTAPAEPQPLTWSSVRPV